MVRILPYSMQGPQQAKEPRGDAETGQADWNQAEGVMEGSLCKSITTSSFLRPDNASHQLPFCVSTALAGSKNRLNPFAAVGETG